MVVASGDGQTAEPGRPLAVKPSVVVRDESGAGVSGVLVTFVVDSGGGVLDGAVATTGGDGTATAGVWTLGHAEGRNVLRASTGTLPPVRLTANATIVGGALPESVIGAGGGTIAINQGPLTGFQLDVPAGAFANGLRAVVSYASNASVPRRNAVNPVGPLITIATGSTDYALAPMRLHIAARIPANTFPVVVLYDAASGAMRALATTAWDSSGVTTVLGHLSSANIVPARLAALRSKSANANVGGGPPAALFINAVPNAVLQEDFDTGFRPGVNDWEFPPTPTIRSFGAKTSLEADAGMAMTAAYYYAAQRSAQPLWKRYQEASGVLASNRLGLRWTATALDDEMHASLLAMQRGIEVMTGHAPASPSVTAQRNELLSLRAMWALTAPNPEPQAVTMLRYANGLLVNATMLVAYRITGNTVYLADPFAPGDNARTMQFSADGEMAPYETNGQSFSDLFVSSFDTYFPTDKLAKGFARVQAGTVGDVEFLPYAFQSNYGPLRDTLWIADTLRVWAEAPGLFPPLTSPDAREAKFSLTDLQVFNRSSVTTQWSTLGHALVASFNNTNKPVDQIGASETYGFVLSGPPVLPGSEAAGSLAWLDWHRLTVIKLGASISPAPLRPFVGVPYAMTAQITGTPPKHVTYNWEWGDGTPDTVIDDNPNVEHTFTRVGTNAIVLKVIDPETLQPYVTARATASTISTFVQFVIAGTWNVSTTPANGSYLFTDFIGLRFALPTPGLDAVFLESDLAPSSVGVLVTLVVPTGSAITTGQTFSKFVLGQQGKAGEFQLTLAQDLRDPANSAAFAPTGTGSLKIDRISKLTDNTFVAEYSFNVANGAGGTITGSGVGRWK
jgi:hypothetical protein